MAEWRQADGDKDLQHDAKDMARRSIRNELGADFVGRFYQQIWDELGDAVKEVEDDMVRERDEGVGDRDTSTGQDICTLPSD
jgi:hypothetical protein